VEVPEEHPDIKEYNAGPLEPGRLGLVKSTEVEVLCDETDPSNVWDMDTLVAEIAQELAGDLHTGKCADCVGLCSDHADVFHAVSSASSTTNGWTTLVQGVLTAAKTRRLYQLRDVWIKEESWLQRIARRQEGNPQNSPCTDLVVKVLKRPSSFGAPKRNSIMQFRRWGKSRTLTSAPHLRNLVRAGGERFITSKFLHAMHPQCRFRILWMSMGIFLMMFDLIVLPMKAFPLPDSPLMHVLDLYGQVFWTLDISITFLTGVYIQSELVMDLRTIARLYATSWLTLDVFVVIPLWLLILFPNSMFQNFIAVKNFRFLRFLRLVRIAKFEHYFQEALAAVNSSVLILCFGIARLMVTLLMFNHFNACLWWAIGTRYPNGWAHKYQQNTTVSYQYLTSLHWALTQFQGTSEILPGTITLERGWAVVTVMLALMILCSVVGGLTNMMMQLQSLREEQVWTQRAVCSYLMFNKISVRLSVRIKKYID